MHDDCVFCSGAGEHPDPMGFLQSQHRHLIHRLWQLPAEKEDLSGRVGGLMVDNVEMGFIAGTSIPKGTILTPEHSLQKVMLIVDCVRHTTHPNKGANKILSSNTVRYTSQKCIL